MKSAILRGPSLTQSGYGVHCRQIAEWLLSKQDVDVKFQVLPWGDTPWILDNNSYDGLVEKITKKSVDGNVEKKYDVSLQLQLPNEWDPTIANFNVGITAGVETDVCNPSWVKSCNAMDVVIVPSKHAANCLKNSGNITKPIKVVPESFCNSILDYDDSQENPFPRFSTNFNFLIFGQTTGDNPFNDRKNIFFTIKWLCEAFKNDKDVGIVIKTNIGRNTKIDYNKTKQMLKMLLRECRKGDFPKLHLLHGEMSDNEIAHLYKHDQIKALVSLTRGEGFGLPILEAAASGLPVIATEWSGHTDFLNHGKYIPVSYSLTPVHKTRVDEKIFISGAKWAEPLEDDFKKKVLKFRNSSATPKEWAEKLSKVLKEKYSLKSIFSQYDEVLKDVL